MKLGIKVADLPVSINDLKETGARFAEVWFQINRAADYNGIFEYLKLQKIEAGLHFWGTLSSGYLANIADPSDPERLNESVDLIKKTLEIAAKNHFRYVNIHPGSAAKIRVELKKWTYQEITQMVSLKDAENCFLANAQNLNDYARKLGVLLTVETIPPRVLSGSLDERISDIKVINAYELPITTIYRAAGQSIMIANDFSHTAANFSDLNNPQLIYEALLKTTEKLFPVTKLIHIGFINNSFTGTDYHGSLDDKIFLENKTVPNLEELKKLLKLFKNRDDVRGLVEPVKDHIKNYFLAKKLIDTEES